MEIMNSFLRRIDFVILQISLWNERGIVIFFSENCSVRGEFKDGRRKCPN